MKYPIILLSSLFLLMIPSTASAIGPFGDWSRLTCVVTWSCSNTDGYRAALRNHASGAMKPRKADSEPTLTVELKSMSNPLNLPGGNEIRRYKGSCPIRTWEVAVLQ